MAALRSTPALVLALVPVAFAPACGDDGGSSDDAMVTTGGADDDGSAGPASTGPGGSSGAESSSGADTTGGGDEEYAALVIGELFTDDLAMAQMVHDQVAMGGQAAAEAAGDFGHDAKLGTTLLGTTENEFLGVDQWTSLDGANAVYGDPMFQMAFGMLFAAPVAPALFEKAPQWHTWGDLEAGDGFDPHFFIVVRGRLAEADLAAAQAMHDAVASGGEAMAMAAGDVAHVVYLGVEDPQEFLAFDVWDADANIEAFYTDPAFVAAFGALFEAPPTIGVYASTDWHQW